MMTHIRAITLLISLLVIPGIILAGCSKATQSPTTTGFPTTTGSPTTEPTTTTELPTTTEPGYLKATAVKHGISFSFEYPDSYYKLTPYAFEDNGGDPSVSLLYARPDSIVSLNDKQIYIRLNDPIAVRPNAAAWTEDHIRLLESNDPDYQLIKRSTIQVAGINGELVAYHSSTLGKYLSSPNLTVWDAYFDYKGYIWRISVLAINQIGDQVEPEFDRLVKSFQLLD